MALTSLKGDLDMGIASIILGGLGAIVKPIAAVVTAKTRAKVTIERGKQKILAAQVDGQNTLSLTDAEWESIAAKGNEESWKDEYVTVICTSPYVLIVIGALATAFGYPMILEGAMLGIAKLTDIGIEVGHMVQVVVYAAVGLKIWRGR